LSFLFQQATFETLNLTLKANRLFHRQNESDTSARLFEMSFVEQERLEDGQRWHTVTSVV